MLPTSVEARAKMKITLGQAEELPDSSSVRVVVWRAWSSAGAAATRPAAARMLRNFMLAVWLSCCFCLCVRV